MKISIARRDLHPTLAAVQRIVERRNTVPILSNVLLEADGGGLTLRATDLDIEIATRIAAEVEEPGSITVQAGRLHDVVGKIGDGLIFLEAAGEMASEVKIAAGRARFALQALPASDFPSLAAGDLPHAFALPADLLGAAIDAVALAISTEETRYYLNGIFVHVDEFGRLVFVASDGHRLSLLRRDLPEGAAAMPGIIVPRKTVLELSRICRGEPREARIQVSDAKIRVEIGDMTLVSKLIDGTFPDYVRVIPSAPPIVALVPRQATRDAVDRVLAVSAERGRAVKITIDATAREMRLEVVNPDSGTAAETVDLASADGNLEIGLNGRYLAEALDALPGDMIHLADTDPGSPVRLTPADDPDGARRLIVVMPMRV